MTSKTRTIELDEAVADALEARAAERGVSLSVLVTELASLESGPLAIATDEIAELDRRWSAIEAGAATASNADVVRWLDTWGTPAFRPWQNR